MKNAKKIKILRAFPFCDAVISFNNNEETADKIVEIKVKYKGKNHSSLQAGYLYYDSLYKILKEKGKEHIPSVTRLSDNELIEELNKSENAIGSLYGWKVISILLPSGLGDAIDPAINKTFFALDNGSDEMYLEIAL